MATLLLVGATGLVGQSVLRQALAGADQIALIGSDGTSAHLQADGGVAPMRAWIVSKLEGGQGAFEARRRAYETPAT